MQMTFKLSAHCTKDRIDRLTFIMLNTGLGETFCEYLKYEDNTLYRLTTTGVLMILNPVDKILVTAYYVDEAKACAIMKACHRNINRSQYYKIIRANLKLREQQNKIVY